MLEYGYSPTFNWTLEAFSSCDSSDVYVLSVFEYFFRRYCFAQKLFGVFKLLGDCSSANLDFTCYQASSLKG